MRREMRDKSESGISDKKIFSYYQYDSFRDEKIIIMARKTAANPDAYYLDLRVRLSVGCKRRSYFFFLYLPVFSYLRLWYSVH